ncbi:hypothetical protein TWF225_007781 [Orbilia oligospora]|uniref:Uncharacterized protein n=1 Tax=Orbilia oligospora TaxID=2813651 RepID=A0A7C8P7X9_ORBOL|nr:hypothetical protein TWF751_010679 [Orbilia oligospora]KAF3178753.1 hypothetical protein TWF225_007781 [Orbilia oligospora]KAF3235846.1 hypothetical protein TWF217_002858 [Orbilia oligospora]KAF3242088.1 hypothetical protein TWF128_010568 [Orbilia oligospora]TGJ65659.1 hypothetical protein EYR41_009610 [Orbilia oligospora]
MGAGHIYRTPLYLYSKPDVTIVAGDDEIGVHEFVLASQSEFFKAALHSGLKESREKHITLPEIQPKVIITVLNWLYRAPLDPYFDGATPDDVFSDGSSEKLNDIMRAFDFLQIKGVGRDYCKLVEEYLQKIKTDEFSRVYSYQARPIIVQSNEIYKSGGSITKEALAKLVSGIAADKSSNHVADDFIRALQLLPDPDGRFLRDFSLELIRRIKT